MIDRDELTAELGFDYEPCCKIEALKRLVRDLLSSKSLFSYELLAERWGWVESEVTDFLHGLEDERILALGNCKKGVVINFGKGSDAVLYKIWE